MRFSCAIVAGLVSLSISSAQTKPDRKTLIEKKIPGYTLRKIEGFDCLIQEEVIRNNDDVKWKRKPLDVLELELGTVLRVLPKKVETLLKTIVVWVEWKDENDPDIKSSVAKYYGLLGGNVSIWSLQEKKHPGKVNNVEIINMESLTAEHQPDVKLERCVLLHEFAHAVHFQIVGNSNAVVYSTFERAHVNKLYTTSKDINGKIVSPYAQSNPQEYFAELTCCYLNKLHYFPFTRDDLKKHDSEGYKLMEKVWGKAEKIDAAIKVENENASVQLMVKAKSLLKDKKTPEAKVILQKIVDYFPKTTPAKDAAKLLES
jgi:hypothetical protein